MKTSISISVAILAFAAWLGHAGEQHIRTAREARARLLADMARAGIPADTGPNTSKAATKRPRDKERQDIRALAASLADCFRMPAGERASVADERLESLSALSPAEFIELIAALRSEKCPEDGLDTVFYSFSRIHPRGILEFLAKSPLELPDTGGVGNQNVINGSIFMWSREDPEAALEWYRRHKDKSPLFSSPEAKNFLLSGVSLKSPATAFRILGELGLPAGSVSQIMGSIRPESRLEGLAELRAFSKNRDPDGDDGLLRNGISSLARSISYQDFPDAEEWIHSAKLDPSELQAFVGGVEEDNLKDNRRWIEWIDRTLPEGAGDGKIRELFRGWAISDYRAAGEWLDAQPEGSTRNTSIQAYAEILSQGRPLDAEKWAMMLPPGERRDGTLRTIFQNWPETDDTSRAAARAFAEQHGIDIGEDGSEDGSEDESGDK
ncbi:hypothetical protein JIN84_00790 [Luteolibacter yonseiensis]|uniref:Uncharacterized protein n=1 Tax=Luteolibacter yonseiensis TaxID=1144680 RepID=A0A934R2N2_9BACT|nr:hypothetical protein [Luteolibacter yonseiensis]MBK1814144.1 hypothetical protein [Luteolibacter yonseiensis]